MLVSARRGHVAPVDQDQQPSSKPYHEATSAWSYGASRCHTVSLGERDQGLRRRPSLSSKADQYTRACLMTRDEHPVSRPAASPQFGTCPPDSTANVCHCRYAVSLTCRSLSGDAERASDSPPLRFRHPARGRERGKSGEAYNVASEEVLPLKEVAELIGSISGSEVMIEPQQEKGMAYSKAGHAILSIEKIKHLGWKPQVSLKDGICRTFSASDGR